ncbi:hypothetical protein [Maribacter sp. Asnod2-G09]|uniref:hypothetical protein n=1 Tax=Maribacter sp. Asnod2-G09 TaxID=3160577 RepID=UPI0038654312
MNKTIIGYGSFFHKTDIDQISETDHSFLGEHHLFYAGRYAMRFIFEAVLKEREIKTIWLPNYYCPFVKDWLENTFSQIAYYDIDPFDAEAKVNFLEFETTDMVLVNNFWGLKSNTIPQCDRPIIIEDHSHGWLTDGCIESEADFCIASLRKTLPVPLGGIAWKPKKSSSTIAFPALQKNNNIDTVNSMTTSWDAMSLAMQLKDSCEREQDKNVFLSTYNQGENILRDIQEIIPLHNEHEKVIRNALFRDFNYFKSKNSAYVKTKISQNNNFKVLDAKNKVPFGLLLIFKDRESLIQLKQFLVSNAIYPAELWPQNNIKYTYQFLLNVHIDFRYDTQDLDHIADVINRYRPSVLKHEA